MTQPEGTVNYTYDAVGFLDSVTDWNGEVTTFGNDADGRVLTVARANGVDTTHTFDDAGRLTAVLHEHSVSGVVDEFVYTLDPNGNRSLRSSGSLLTVAAAQHPLRDRQVHDPAVLGVGHVDGPHAEEKLLAFGATFGVLHEKLAIGVSNNFCEICQRELEVTGAVIMPRFGLDRGPKRAYWLPGLG